MPDAEGQENVPQVAALLARKDKLEKQLAKVNQALAALEEFPEFGSIKKLMCEAGVSVA